MKITKGENDWKFEFTIVKTGFEHIRAKIYSKTAEKVTSLGVGHLSVGDPLSKLLLTNDTTANLYAKTLFSFKGLVDSRIEVSFYGDVLKKPNTYIQCIRKLFFKCRNSPRNRQSKGFINLNDYPIIAFPCFTKVLVEHYFDKLL